MATLLMRLSGPLQSWGTADSRFARYRDTAREPTKSGIVGLIAAALGRPRAATVDDIAALRMGVRVDQPGEILCDFQTIQNVLRASGAKGRSVISYRWYLSDARFLVGLEGDDAAFLKHIHRALSNPVWLLYLGRKKFVPGEPIGLHDGLWDQPLLDALSAYPWLGIDERCRPETVRVVYQDRHGDEQRRDQPRGVIEERRFAPRWVTTTMIDVPTSEAKEEE